MIAFRTCVAVLVIALPCIASAQHAGSMEDQMACTPDVYRLCASQIPDEDAIVACLTQHKASLSAGCSRVFSRPDPGQNAPPSEDE